MHWFGVTGLANGLAVLGDEETWSAWDHITGEAFDGPLAGERLAAWPIVISSVAAELERDRSLLVLRQSYRWTLKRVLQSVPTYRTTAERTRFPPGFRRTLSGPVDPRRPVFEPGLGVIVGERARFYPFAGLPDGSAVTDEWFGRPLYVTRQAPDAPRARWIDRPEIPMQLLTRWYGFVFTYPKCSIYEPSG